mgnify:CR=1 FL=1
MCIFIVTEEFFHKLTLVAIANRNFRYIYDIIVDFSQPIGIEFIDLADFIEKKLSKNVDLVSKNGVKQKYYRTIESEIIYV